MEIKAGDWVVFRNGNVLGKIQETPFGAYRWRIDNFMWMGDGKFLNSGDENTECQFDIIATLPCSPLERIQQIEKALEFYETDHIHEDYVMERANV